MTHCFKVFADGSLIDYVYADSPEQAIELAKIKHGTADHWFAKRI